MENLGIIKFLGIPGSLRKESYNKKLLYEASKLLPKNTELEIFGLNDIPLYNADIEAAVLPDSVRILKEKIKESDALLIACPEYNYSVTGVLKNAIDWASRGGVDSPLYRKPYALFGAGGISGTIRAQLHFRQIALHNNMQAVNKPEVYIQFASEKFDQSGNLTDEKVKENILKQLIALRDLVIQLKK